MQRAQVPWASHLNICLWWPSVSAIILFLSVSLSCSLAICSISYHQKGCIDQLIICCNKGHTGTTKIMELFCKFAQRWQIWNSQGKSRHFQSGQKKKKIMNLAVSVEHNIFGAWLRLAKRWPFWKHLHFPGNPRLFIL